MKLTVTATAAEAIGAFGPAAMTLAVELEGRKRWLNNNALRFEATEGNLRLFRQLYPAALESDLRTPASANLEAIQADQPLAQPQPALGPAQGAPAASNLIQPRWKMAPRPFQLENYERFKNKRYFAIFSDPGTGKTKTALDIISYRFLAGRLQTVLVFSPDGVHIQWIEEQLGLHLWDGIRVKAHWWDKRNLPYWLTKPEPNTLQLFSANVDMVRGDATFKTLSEIVGMVPGEKMMLIDESHTCKNASSKRSRRMRELGEKCDQRAIMTGTPLSVNLLDEWGQFKFLDERIIGIKYKSAFAMQFCRMGGFQNRAVIGPRNLDQFKAITAPHIFRATKKELNLPDPIYDHVVFDLTEEQKRLIKQLKEEGATKLAGNQLDIWSAAVLSLRIQQISCGFIKQDDKLIPLSENPRLTALTQFLAGLEGQKVIVWARFIYDIKLLAKTLGNRCVTYYGADDAEARRENKRRFIEDKSIDYFVANPASGGTGLDGLQTICSTAAYYSNSFKYIDRRQSEDRIDRIGSLGVASYFDFIARGGRDRHILANLKAKRSLSELTLDDWKTFFNDEEPAI